jgi:hypothetical protein
MPTQSDFDLFLDVLRRASLEVGEEYFFVRQDSRRDSETEEPITKYFERVYCYELYHWVRCLSSTMEWPRQYGLYGENPKEKTQLHGPNNRTPDFILHNRYSESDNLAVIEAKHVEARLNGQNGIIPAIENLIGMLELEGLNYYRGVLLVYGADEHFGDKDAGICREVNAHNGVQGFNRLIYVRHKSPGVEAEIANT